MWFTFVGSWFSFLVQCICLTVYHDLQLPRRLEIILWLRTGPTGRFSYHPSPLPLVLRRSRNPALDPGGYYVVDSGTCILIQIKSFKNNVRIFDQNSNQIIKRAHVSDRSIRPCF